MAFTDDFTGTSGDNLEDRTGWTLASGTAASAEINASNQLKTNGTGSTGHSYQAPTAGSADHYAQCVYRGGSSGPLAPCVRVTDANNFCGIRAEGTQYNLYQRVAAGFTSKGTYSATPASGDVLKVEISGTTATFYLNGVSRITGTSISGSLTAQTPGLICRTTAVDPFIDDWESTQAGGPVISYFSALSGVSGVNAGSTARGAGVSGIAGAKAAGSASKSISLGLSAIAGSIGSASGTKSASAGISAIAGLLGALETAGVGTTDFNSIAGALVSVTHSTARLSTIEGKVGSIGSVAGLRGAISSLQAIAGAVASIQGPLSDDRTSSFAAIAGAAAALSKTTARIADLAARAGALGTTTAATIRAAQISAVAGLRAAIVGLNGEDVDTLLTVAVSARAAYECVASARAAYNCTISEAIAA